MDMQDKDFDKLFSSKFEDFEAEPSPIVWENIADALEGEKTGRPWVPYLRIAASIAVTFTVGWLFLQKDMHTGEKHHNYANLAHHDMVKPAASATINSIMKQPEPAITDSASENRTLPDRMASNSNRPHKSVLQENEMAVSNKAGDLVKESQPVIATDQQLITQADNPINTLVKPIMPDVQLSPKTIDAMAISVEKPAVVISAEKEIEEPVKKHGIHNLGGLINVLVSKIDKRQNKFIEFSDVEDDEAETSLTGVNLGPIKFKKQ